MAQIRSNCTAPTFSFDAADHPTTWRDFYYRAQDYLELLRIKPTEEDQLKRGWEQITTMFTGENKQILQTLIDNNTITETDQRTPILALKAIQSAIKNKEHHRNSTTMATKSATTTTKSSKCPWRQFYKCIIKYMDSLHAEPCEPQTKIDTFIHAIKHSFPSPTMDWRNMRNLQNKHKPQSKIQATTQRKQPTVRQMTQTQPITQSQKAAMQHTFQDHQKASRLQTLNTSRGPDLLASPFQQRATVRPAISAFRHTCQNQARLHQKPVISAPRHIRQSHRHLQHLHTPSTQGKHHYYLPHHHQ